jgi:uncharacterized protein YhhL (DUF1145 family)
MGDNMLLTLIGILCIILALVLPMPYALYLVLLIGGILLTVYGVYLLLVARRAEPGVRRRWF